MPDPIYLFLVAVVCFILLSMLLVGRLTTFYVTLLLVLLPFSNLVLMPHQVFGVTGLNPVNLIWLVAFLTVVADAAMHRAPWSRPYYFSWPLLLFLVLVAFAALRTALDMGSLKPLSNLYDPRLSGVVVDRFMKPLLYVLTGWMVMRFCLMQGSVVAVRKAVLLSPVLMAPVVLGYFLYGMSGFTVSGDLYVAGRTAVSEGLGLHANDLGALAVAYLACALFMPGRDWRAMRYVAIFSSLMVIALSFSRMAYLTTAVLFAVGFFRLGIYERIMVFVLGFVVFAIFSAQILSRVEYGMEGTKSGYDINAISAGRVEGIWKPLLPYAIDHPVFGGGAYSIWKGPANRSTSLPSHPHNAYLEAMLDMGLVGVLGVVFLLAMLWRRAGPHGELRYVLLTWCLMGLTGNSFYPTLFNLVVWIGLGLAVARSHLALASAPDEVPPPQPVRPGYGDPSAAATRRTARRIGPRRPGRGDGVPSQGTGAAHPRSPFPSGLPERLDGTPGGECPPPAGRPRGV